MFQIPDDPIISCMERTGYPPWMLGGSDDDEEEYDYEEENEADAED